MGIELPKKQAFVHSLTHFKMLYQLISKYSAVDYGISWTTWAKKGVL